MEGLSALVLKVYPGKSKEELEAVRAFGAWMKVLSPRIVKNARPVRLDRGVLTVHTTTSTWANSLQLESESLIAKIARRAPGVRLRKLVFRVGALPEVEPPTPLDPEPEPALAATVLPDDVARELARIGNDGVRDAVAKAAAAGLGTKIARKRERDALLDNPKPPKRRD